MAFPRLSCVLFCIIALHLLILIALGASKLYPRALQKDIYDRASLNEILAGTAAQKQITHKFNHPKIAYEVLKQLDTFKPVNDSYYYIPYNQPDYFYQNMHWHFF